MRRRPSCCRSSAAEEPALDAAPAEEEPLDAEAAPEEDGLADEDIPLGATDDFANLDGQNLGDFAGEGEGQQLTIDLGALQESIEALKQSIDEDEEVDLSEFINEEEDEELDEKWEDLLRVSVGPSLRLKGVAKLGGAAADVTVMTRKSLKKNLPKKWMTMAKMTLKTRPPKLPQVQP